MPKSISRTAKPPGRPPTNPTSIHLTLTPEPLANVDNWIQQQDDKPSRPEAIRRLVDLGLRSVHPAVKASEAQFHAAQASKLAKELGLKPKRK